MEDGSIPNYTADFVMLHSWYTVETASSESALADMKLCSLASDDHMNRNPFLRDALS